MDDILALTTIPDLMTQHKDEIALGLKYDGTEDDRESTLMLWFNNIGSGKQGTAGQSGAFFALRAYNVLKEYCASPVSKWLYDVLVDEPRVRALGLNPNYLGSFLKNKRRAKDDFHDLHTTAFLAIFLNTLGLTGKVALDTVMHFYDTAYSGKVTDTLNRVNKKDKMHGWDDYSGIGHKMNTQDIKDLCSTSLHAHLNKKEVTATIKENREVVLKCVEDVLSVPVFTAETLLTEIFHQIIEPLHARDLFLRAASFGAVNPGMFLGKRLDTLIRGKRVELLGPRQPTMSDELFNIVLPRRFRLKDGMTVAFLDVFLDTLLGAPVEVKQAVHDIVSFACVRGLCDSDGIAEVLDRVENQVSESEKDECDFWGIFLREWRRQQIFVLWLEMVRRTVSSLTDLTIGCIDSITTSPQLPERTLYYFRGNYYVRIEEKTINSPSFKEAIEAVWHESCPI